MCCNPVHPPVNNSACSTHPTRTTTRYTTHNPLAFKHPFYTYDRSRGGVPFLPLGCHASIIRRQLSRWCSNALRKSEKTPAGPLSNQWENEAVTNPPPRSHAHDGMLQQFHPRGAVCLFRASVNPSPPVVLAVYSPYSVCLLFTYLTQSTYTPSLKMNRYATGCNYGVASEAMLCSSIAKLDRLDEFQPPAVVCHAMGTRDSHYIIR